MISVWYDVWDTRDDQELGPFPSREDAQEAVSFWDGGKPSGRFVIIKKQSFSPSAAY